MGIEILPDGSVQMEMTRKMTTPSNEKSSINWTDRKFSTLKYPDLGHDFYPDCICFTVQKRTGVAVDAVTKIVTAGIDQSKKSIKNQEAFTKWMGPKLKDWKAHHGEEATEKNQEGWKSHLKAKWNAEHEDQKALVDDMLGVAADFFKSAGAEMETQQTQALSVAKEGKNIIGSIYLNMPNAIQFNEAANWSGDSLGFMGKSTQDFFTGNSDGGAVAGALAGSAGNVIGGAIGAIPSLMSTLGIKGGMFGAAIGAMAAGTPIQKGAESALGIAQNPYMEMMFSGIGFRKFQFDFILRPKSTKEVQEVGEIIKMFRTHSKPSYVEGKLGTSFMNYPMEFKIEFLTSGAKKLPTDTKAIRNDMDSFMTNPHVPKLKACVCDNVTTNYTPQSIWAAHKQGAPVAVTLNLSFQETELVMADDVYSENY